MALDVLHRSGADWNNLNDVQTAKSVDTFESGFRNYLLKSE